MECYNVMRDLDQGYALNINIPESKGMCVVEGPRISGNQFVSPFNIKKVNIGSTKNPNFANIGDYWDDEIVGKITDSLHEF